MKRTQADRAERFVADFIRLFPDAFSIVSVDYETLEKIVAPLGLADQRAKSLKNFAAYVVVNHQGKLPTSLEELRKIPGLGDYSASAVAYSAFNIKTVGIDSNIVRLVKRLTGLTPTKNDERWCLDIRQVANSMSEHSEDPKILNWGLLDIAALICKPSRPLCEICPLNDVCHSAFDFPNKGKVQKNTSVNNLKLHP